MVSIEEFMKIEFRTAKILSVEDVQGRDKLYKIYFDLGNGEKKQTLSGVRQHYTKEQLMGRTVIIVANLDPTIIAGHKSETMLLAADSKNGPILAGFEHPVEPGN